MLNKLLLALLLVSAAGISCATATWHESTLKYVYLLSDGRALFAFNTDASGCTAPAPKYHYLAVGQNGITADAFKNIYAAALAAASTHATVQFTYDNATSYCYVGSFLVSY